MPIFITRGRYSSESIKNLVASPEDRQQSVAQLVESTGGKLLNFYVTLGQYDFLTIVEAASARELPPSFSPQPRQGLSRISRRQRRLQAPKRSRCLRLQQRPSAST